MARKKFNFTIRAIDQLELPDKGKREVYYDTKVPHLALRVSDKGTKTFMIYRWVDGRALKRTLGRFPQISIEQARKLAEQTNFQLTQGIDPLEEKREAREELTLSELFEHYMNGYARGRCTTADDMEKNFERYFGHWNRRKLSSISKMDVQRQINKLAEDNHFHRANRAHDTIRAVFEWGIKKGLFAGPNPCVGIDRFKTESRERFIKPEELVSFFQSLAEETNETIRDYLFISILTGARQANVLAMRWDEVDLNRGSWRIPKTKNKESHTVPLTPFAVSILQSRLRKNKGVWVFPGKKPGSHLQEPKATWRKVVKRAGLADLRVHDLRRTLGSYMAMGNQSLQIIGKALGHKSHTSTLIYARLADDPVRQGMYKAQQEMLEVGDFLSKLNEIYKNDN